MAIFSLRGWVIQLRTILDKKGILWCSFVPKRSKIGQEIAELWPFSPWEVAWFHWETHGKKREPLVFICTKEIQNLPRNSWVMAIFYLRGCVIPLRSTWYKRGSLAAYFYKKNQKSAERLPMIAIIVSLHHAPLHPWILHHASFHHASLSHCNEYFWLINGWVIRRSQISTQSKCIHELWRVLNPLQLTAFSTACKQIQLNVTSLGSLMLVSVHFR